MLTIPEILAQANDDVKTIMAHAANRYLRNLMEAAYLPGKKFNLPEGIPPFKPNAQHEAQTPGGIFWQIAKKIDLLQRKDLKAARQEAVFIQALESLAAVDAEIFIAVKEQTLHKKYKKLTLAALTKAGYFQ